MEALQYLNAVISERLAAAAVEIFGAVEKTFTEYQGEISRSKQEIDHLRTLVLCPQIRLHRSAQQVSPHCCDLEASPVSCSKEDVWAPDASPEHPGPLHTKDQRADHQRGSSWRQQCDAIVSPQFVKREHPENSPSHVYQVLTVEQAADIKTEPDGDEFITSPPAREAEISCGEKPESSGLQRLKDPLEITHHEQDESDEQQDNEQAWSPCQEHKDLNPPHIKVERFTPSAPLQETDHDSKLPSESERSVCDEEKSRDGETEGYELGVPQTYYSVNPDYIASQSKHGDGAEGVVNGEWIKVLTPTGTVQKTRQNSNLCCQERFSIETEEDINYFTRERRHTCPICAKRFKESSHLKDHVRIHTGEKPYQCKECSKNFRQSGALTLHMRIHTGERPYQCTECGRRFNRKGDMETHRVTHTGERPHLCLVCGKSFKRKSNLNTHLKTHAEDRMDYTQPL
ncbi:zinc finger protein 544-like [Scomber scombrus]|uniref:Zinc finger protein 544-like n=1 Tax=Scomber scombrus TaxID=13677 RepID=A0AAV1NHP2_SCOSC